MDMFVEFQDSMFRVTTQEFFFELVDTVENRQVAVVLLRCLRDAEAQPLFTLQQLAGIVESDHRQAAGCPSGHVSGGWGGVQGVGRAETEGGCRGG